MSLINLPAELLFIIADNLPQLKHLFSLTQTNSRLSHLLTPIIHKAGLQDVNSMTPLQWAAMHGHTSLIRLAISAGHDVNYHGPGHTIELRPGFMHKAPLLYAIDHNHLAALSLLLENGADANLSIYGLPGLPLHFAIGRNSEPMVRMLLAHGANPNSEYAIFQGDHIPLHVAMNTANVSRPVVQALLEAGADPKDPRGYLARTPLHSYLHSYIQLDIVQMMIEWGADVNTVDRRGWTMLWSVLEGDTEPTAKTRQTRLEVFQLLCRHGADISIRNTDGAHVLQAAVTNRNVGIIQFLLEMGVDVMTRNWLGRTSFDGYDVTGYPWAGCGIKASSDELKIVRRLLYRGVAFRRWDCEKMRIVYVG